MVRFYGDKAKADAVYAYVVLCYDWTGMQANMPAAAANLLLRMTLLK